MIYLLDTNVISETTRRMPNLRPEVYAEHPCARLDHSFDEKRLALEMRIDASRTPP